jgi:hypothetical protein
MPGNPLRFSVQGGPGLQRDFGRRFPRPGQDRRIVGLLSVSSGRSLSRPRSGPHSRQSPTAGYRRHTGDGDGCRSHVTHQNRLPIASTENDDR